MPEDLKKIRAVFYKTINGAEPVREWLLGISQADRKIIGQDIVRVEYGWPIGMPTCKPLGNGLFEVRSDLPDGQIARVLFCLTEGNLILLHGFVKKSQKTPKPDLMLGRLRQKEVQR